MVYIVMIGIPSAYSYDGLVWTPDRVFSKEISAKNYIKERKLVCGSEVEFDIEKHELLD